jgi:predicted nucleotidyltransferase
MGKERPDCSEMDKRSAKSQLKKLLKMIEQADVPVRNVLIFGSHAKGIATKLSDLDVCLVFADKVKDAPNMAAYLRYNLGRLNLNIDLSSLYEGEIKKNKISCFINEIRTSSISAEDFLTQRSTKKSF